MPKDSKYVQGIVSSRHVEDILNDRRGSIAVRAQAFIYEPRPSNIFGKCAKFDNPLGGEGVGNKLQGKYSRLKLQEALGLNSDNNL